MKTKRTIETAEYIRAQAKELAKLSREAGLDNLVYLLEVVELEAESRVTTKNRIGIFSSVN